MNALPRSCLFDYTTHVKVSGKQRKKGSEVSGRLWVSKNDKGFLGKGRMELLERISEKGSITEAARTMKMSYKAAWDAVDAMNNLSSKPLVVSAAGGREGGGTQLTDAGKKVIAMFRTMEAEHERFLANMTKKIADFDKFYSFLRRISMRISARNLVLGTITEVKKGEVAAIVKLSLASGSHITSIITNESVEGLNLKSGVEAYAIIKASSVMIATAVSGMRLSARNIIPGTISKIKKGRVMAEVVLDIGGGNTISSMISDESVKRLDLREGGEAYAVVKAASVIIGVE